MRSFSLLDFCYTLYGGFFMLYIGSHVGFKKDSQLLGSLQEALSYGANTFMFYTELLKILVVILFKMV